MVLVAGSGESCVRWKSSASERARFLFGVDISIDCSFVAFSNPCVSSLVNFLLATDQRDHLLSVEFYDWPSVLGRHLSDAQHRRSISNERISSRSSVRRGCSSFPREFPQRKAKVSRALRLHHSEENNKNNKQIFTPVILPFEVFDTPATMDLFTPNFLETPSITSPIISDSPFPIVVVSQVTNSTALPPLKDETGDDSPGNEKLSKIKNELRQSFRQPTVSPFFTKSEPPGAKTLSIPSSMENGDPSTADVSIRHCFDSLLLPVLLFRWCTISNRSINIPRERTVNEKVRQWWEWSR